MHSLKKIAVFGAIFACIIGMNSCDYDDSNDIDVLTPNDSTQTSSLYAEHLILTDEEQNISYYR